MTPTAQAIVSLNSSNFDNHELPLLVKNRLTCIELGLNVVPTVVVLPSAFHQFCLESNLLHQIQSHLSMLDPLNPDSVFTTAKNIRKRILDTPLPKSLFKELDFQVKHQLQDQWLTLEKNPILKPNLSLHTAFRGESVLAKKIVESWADWFSPPHLSLISKSTIPPVTPLIISALPLATVVGSVSTTSSFLEHKHLMRLQLVAGQSFGPQDEPLLPSNLIIDRDSAQVLSFQPLVQTLRYQLTRDGGLVKVPQKPSPISLKSLNIDKLVKLARTIHHHYLKPQHISFIFTKNDMFIWNVESFNDPLESLTPSPTKH